jgi:hypothetical protein
MDFRIVRGTPTPEELAALVGVLALRPVAVDDTPAPVSRWALAARPGASGRSAALGRPGRDAWKASGLPR